MEVISDFLIYLADKFPVISFVLTLLAVLVVLCSLLIKTFPAVDKQGKLAKVVHMLDFLSVFYPKWKENKEISGTETAND